MKAQTFLLSAGFFGLSLMAYKNDLMILQASLWLIGAGFFIKALTLSSN